jgi:hypothetical protein
MASSRYTPLLYPKDSGPRLRVEKRILKSRERQEDQACGNNQDVNETKAEQD